MNIYDFDETIFYPNSAWAFGTWSFRRNIPRTLLALPSIIWAAIQLLFKRISLDIFKLRLFCFMRYIPDPDREIAEFWDEHEKNISEWYIGQKRSDDLIISASPDFLIKEIGRRLNVHVIATKMDIKTGKILSENCAEAEKVRRFREEYPSAKVNEFYSDSERDTPMAKIAVQAYKVIDKGTKPVPWKWEK